MPINIYADDESKRRIAWLCDDNWRLPDQIEALESWLELNRSKVKGGRYIADIGFAPREDASGGTAISPAMLRTLADLGISLFLSEYPPITNGQ